MEQPDYEGVEGQQGDPENLQEEHQEGQQEQEEEENDLQFHYPAVDPPNALYYTRNLRYLGSLVDVIQHPNLPPAVYFFIYCQEKCQEQWGKDIIPFMLDRQRLVGPRHPKYYTQALNSWDAFYYSVLSLMYEDFYPRSISYTTFPMFIEKEVFPHWDKIPAEYQSYLLPYRISPSAPLVTGTGENINNQVFHGYSTAQTPGGGPIAYAAAGPTAPATQVPPAQQGAMNPPGAAPAPRAATGAPAPTAPPPAAATQAAHAPSAVTPPHSTVSGGTTTSNSALNQLLFPSDITAGGGSGPSTSTTPVVPVVPVTGMSGAQMMQSLQEIFSRHISTASHLPSATAPSDVTGIAYDWPSIRQQLDNLFGPEVRGPAISAATFNPAFLFNAAAPRQNPATAPVISTAAIAAAANAVTTAATANPAVASTAGGTAQVSLAPLSSTAYRFAFPFQAQQLSLPSFITSSSAYQMPFVPMNNPINPTLFQPSLLVPSTVTTSQAMPALSSTHPTPVTVLNSTPPPKFSGYLTSEITDLHVWYRRVERVALKQNSHILDVLDECTSKDANCLIQQMFNQHLHDPEQIKSHFFAHYSFIQRENTDDAFDKLMNGKAITMRADEHMETYISRFRLFLAKAGISEVDVASNSVLVKTLVSKFVQGLPEVHFKELKNGKKGVPFASMQALYDSAVESGRKHPPKRKTDEKTSKDVEPPSKKQKVPYSSTKKALMQKSSTQKSKSKSPPHHKSATQGPKKTYSEVLQKAKAKAEKSKTVLNALPQQQKTAQPAVKGLIAVPDWPAPFPVNDTPSEVDPSEMTPPILKQIVGTTRFNKSSHANKCVFCALPLNGEIPSVHYAKCSHNPL